MIKRINPPADLALIELSRHGRTDAPRVVLAGLEARGSVTSADSPKLTDKGIRRVAALKKLEPELRGMVEAQAGNHGSTSTIRTIGGCSLRT